MTKHTVKILFLITILGSCKKKETETQAQSTNSLFACINTPYTISTAIVFSGFFTSVAWAQKTGTILTGGNYSVAFFTDSLVSIQGQSNGLQMNAIRHNSARPAWRTTYMDYADYNTSNFDSELWQINGANGFPSFNFTNKNTPKCNNLSALPDTISLSSGFTININLSNVMTKGFEFAINDGYNFGGPIFRPLYNGNNVLTYTPTDLASFGFYCNGSIFINLENDQALNFSGKDFMFIKQSQYMKYIWIKP